MNNYAVTSHYAKALLNLLPSLEQKEKTLSTLEEIGHQLKNTPELQQVLTSPSIPNQEKKNVLKTLWREQLDSKLLHFLFILIDKGRFSSLPEINAKYQRLVKKELGILTVRVTTAIPLDSMLKEKLQNKLERSYQKKIELTENIDPQIIGGIILMIEDQMLDYSIKSRLNTLRKSL